MTCPRCGEEAEGRFCGHCGGSLRSRPCPGCGTRVQAGLRFCTDCGGTLGRERERPGDPGRTGWWIAGGATIVALAVLAVPSVWSDAPAGSEGDRFRMTLGGEASASSPGPGASGAAVDLSQLSPRAAADQLYDRVMRARSRGDEAEVELFLPMALEAYELVGALDADGLFHLSLLQQLAGDQEQALGTAEAILESEPDHLLALYAAAEAAREMGRTESAGAHYRRLLDVFEEESGRELPEYREHAALLPEARDAARSYLAGGR